MLKSIFCNKFKENGLLRNEIFFNENLNVILGSDDGANSTGKTTFLMIIDFVFGGNDYINSKTNIVLEKENIGHHEIDFEFIFNNNSYFFKRKTKFPHLVYICNENYIIIKEIKISEYKVFLSKMYNIDNLELTFRELVGTFIRVYHRETLNEKLPLQQASKEPIEKSLIRLQKLFNFYHEIKELKLVLDNLKKENDLLKETYKLGYIKKSKNQKEFSANLKKIEENNLKINSFFNNDNIYDICITKERSEYVNDLILNRENLQKNLFSIKYKIKKFENEIKESYIDEKELNKIKTFFPEINSKKIDEIEFFHNKLKNILLNEYNKNYEYYKKIQLKIEYDLKELDSKLNNIFIKHDISYKILKEYLDLFLQNKILEEANNNYKKFLEISETILSNEKKYNEKIKDISKNIEKIINENLIKFSNIIFSNDNIPKIKINEKKYTYGLDNDFGTGIQYKNLILFDLVILEKTNLPILIHDTILFKNISDENIKEILKLYIKQKKQIFISFDKCSSQNIESQKILRKNTVLKLGKNGNELFGKNFNLKNS